jgi:hypothetical protein
MRVTASRTLEWLGFALALGFAASGTVWAFHPFHPAPRPIAPPPLLPRIPIEQLRAKGVAPPRPDAPSKTRPQPAPGPRLHLAAPTTAPARDLKAPPRSRLPFDRPLAPSLVTKPDAKQGAVQ